MVRRFEKPACGWMAEVEITLDHTKEHPVSTSATQAGSQEAD